MQTDAHARTYNIRSQCKRIRRIVFVSSFIYVCVHINNTRDERRSVNIHLGYMFALSKRIQVRIKTKI
jgi:hypothetical protein